MPEDYAEKLRADRKRRALVMAGVLLLGIVALIVVLKLASDEMATPTRPLGSSSLTRERQSFEFEVADPGPVALWISLTVAAWWEPAADADDVTVERVVLTPSIE